VFTSASKTVYSAYKDLNVTLGAARQQGSANQAPTASFTADPTSGEAPLVVSFDAAASSDPDGTIASYTWDFGDGSTGTGATISHDYTAAGIYPVTLAVTDDGGATDTAMATITVNPAPVAPSITSQPADQTVSEGQTATFSVVAAGTEPGATDPSYTTPATALVDDGATFRCVVTNAAGSATSDAATLTVTAGQARVTDGQQVLYTFEEGSGTTVHDVSGVGSPLDLNVDNAGAVSWVSGGLAINASTLVASAGAATKVIDATRATTELAIEAWLKPGTTSQDGPARIVTLSADPYHRNFWGRGCGAASRQICTMCACARPRPMPMAPRPFLRRLALLRRS
jgi:PKD repeat protein